MPSEPIALFEIPYQRLFPWSRLIRGVGMAADPKKLLLAAVGLLLLHLGWRGLDEVFLGSVSITPDVYSSIEAGLEPTADGLGRAIMAPTEPVRFLTAPFLALFSTRLDGLGFLHAALASLWTILVWGLIGGAIARIAVVQWARSERVGMVAALRHSLRNWTAVWGAPLLPISGIGVVVALCSLFGLLYRIPHPIGARIAGLFSFFPLLAGLVLTLIVIGLAAAWPLMIATAAAEGEDGLDALSRSYAYVNQRPWNYLGYTALVWLIGIVGWVFVMLFAVLVVHLAHWSLSFTASGTALGSLFEAGAPTIDKTASALHGFWLTLVAWLVHGWLYSYFWTSAAAIYLLLRHDVDGTEWQAIDFVDTTPRFDLEPLTTADPALAEPVAP